MSELAFNVNGERFQLPAQATYWRVRRFKASGRGTPEVVFGADGLPLVIDIDTDIAEFHHLVNRVPGRYRLDPIDDQHKACEGGTAAYLQISDTSDCEAESLAPRNAGPADQNVTLIEMIIRANTEMVRSITDKFATVMDSAATLIRAADGAGLPARDPMALPPEIAAALRNAEQPQEEPDDEEEPDWNPHLAAVIQTAVDRAMPLLNHTINTKVLGLSTEQSIALMGGNVGAVKANAAPVGQPDEKANEQTKEEPAAKASAPASPPDFMSHVMAVEALLSPEEAQLAREAIGQMPPEVLVAWRERLLSLSPAEAAEMVKSEIHKNATTQKEAA